MKRHVLSAAMSLVLCGPALAAEPTKPTAKPTVAAKPVAKPAFDARDPASMIRLLAAAGAKTDTPLANGSQLALKVVTPGGGFGMQFANCDAKGKACAGVAFSTSFDRAAPSLNNMNLFNSSQFACRGFIGEDRKPNVMYSTLLTSRMNAEDVKQHLGVWQGCLATFVQFTQDPAAYLAAGG